MTKKKSNIKSEQEEPIKKHKEKLHCCTLETCVKPMHLLLLTAPAETAVPASHMLCVDTVGATLALQDMVGEETKVL